MQAMPLDSPQRAFAVKKATEYERNLAVAQQKAAAAPNPLPFNSFDSQFLDEQLRLFLSYVAAVGPPDVLIVGSSRALQGVDPRQLQFGRSQQGQPGLKVFNLGINGATAQTVELLLSEILTSAQVPSLIIWADGARAFNNGRPDRTHQAIVNSPGYAALQQGQRPTLPVPPATTLNCPPTTSAATVRQQAAEFGHWFAAWSGWSQPALAADVRAIDANGFLAVGDRFDPDTYYNRFPRVAGLYDGDYQNLSFSGAQLAALARLGQAVRSRQIALVFVNLPLSDDYLDATRAEAQVEFRQFMTQQAQQQGFLFIDLGVQWRDRNEFLPILATSIASGPARSRPNSPSIAASPGDWLDRQRRRLPAPP
ncbi:MAG: hypothetical protein HC838_05465, partial [Spirulinaceae cyanobacterium RM2_2_10]|nr:hypothetical protein [Spirulinaceae cyanobacterium RM2_2_10]